MLKAARKRRHYRTANPRIAGRRDDIALVNVWLCVLFGYTGGLLPRKQRAQAGCLLHWISSVNQTLMKKGSRYTILPFKLHRFIAQTGSVYTTLDRGGPERFITLEPGIYKQDDENKKRIYPNVFSRATGQPFLCASHHNYSLLYTQSVTRCWLSCQKPKGLELYRQCLGRRIASRSLQ